MTPYQRTLAAMADAAAMRALTFLAAFLAGRLTHAEAVTAIAATIARANAHAVALADLSLAATLTDRAARPIPVLGLTPSADDLDRLSRAVEVVLQDPAPEDEDEPTNTPQMRVERIARAEPLRAAGDAYNAAVKKSPHVVGYRRGLEPDACELCTWLAKRHLDPAGYVYPAAQPMHQHPGCTCHPIPVTRRSLTRA